MPASHSSADEMTSDIWSALLTAGLIAHAEGGPVVGAIRWDAWTGGKITAEVERSLGPGKSHVCVERIR